MKKCDHKGKTNLAPFAGVTPHWYCPACGWHMYEGREYTKKEWEIYVEN